mgnify:CR=1 FL=1
MYKEKEAKRLIKEEREKVEKAALHAVWVYKKHPYKKQTVDLAKIKKR